MITRVWVKEVVRVVKVEKVIEAKKVKRKTKTVLLKVVWINWQEKE